MEVYEGDPGIDPKNYDFDELLKIYEGYDPVGWGILVRIYQPIRQQKTEGGIFLPDSVISEKQQRDRFYTFKGLVIKLAPGVYKEQDRYSLTGAYCKPGDWIHFSRSDGQTFAWKGLTSIRLEEDRVLAVIKNPEDIMPLASQLYYL